MDDTSSPDSTRLAFDLLADADVRALTDQRLAERRAYHGMMRDLARWARSFELTPARFEMLAAVASHPCGTTQRSIARSLRISQGTTSRMVAKLVNLGLLASADDPTDGRKKLLAVTYEGRRRLEAAQASMGPAALETLN